MRVFIKQVRSERTSLCMSYDTRSKKYLVFFTGDKESVLVTNYGRYTDSLLEANNLFNSWVADNHAEYVNPLHPHRLS